MYVSFYIVTLFTLLEHLDLTPVYVGFELLNL